MKKILLLLPTVLLASCGSFKENVNLITMNNGASFVVNSTDPLVTFRVPPLTVNDPVYINADAERGATLTVGSKSFNMPWGLVGSRDFMYKTAQPCTDLPAGINTYTYQIFDKSGAVIKTESVTVDVRC